MTDAVNRYRFTEKTVTQAKNFLKGTAKTQPNFLKKFKGEVKKNRLFLDGKLVVPKEKVDAYLRNRIYKGRTPLSRDASYYAISRDSVGISRAAIDKFLKGQRIIRETDNQQATSKRGSRKVTKKGQLHYDLIELKFKDLLFDIDASQEHDIEVDEKTGEKIKKGYIFSMVDALTSLAFFKWHPKKSHKYVTPIAKEAFNWFSKKLDVPLNKLVAYSDAGKEWNIKLYNSWGIKTVILKRSSVVEQKNSHFQRVLYRLAKMLKTKSLVVLVKDSMKVVNRTVSSLTKKAPIENIKETQGDLSKKYNKKRGKDSGIKIKRKALDVGDMVRIQRIHDKNKAFYKAYRGKLWTKRRYKVAQKKGNRYKVNKKFYHRDELRLTSNVDEKSELLLAKRFDAL
jgi:hypothetical protein